MQECTVDHAVVHLGPALFATVQVYVTLNRVRSLGGLRIVELDCSKLTGNSVQQKCNEGDGTLCSQRPLRYLPLTYNAKELSTMVPYLFIMTARRLASQIPEMNPVSVWEQMINRLVCEETEAAVLISFCFTEEYSHFTRCRVLILATADQL
ncbi:hypothetical protein TNCV_439521 [Trichonephila clavipes]|nr:hypothetical protein TNCV_439521 [Trichonephila clavipes]